jgi:hypothetical protein
MIRYTVVWDLELQERLAEAWLAADSEVRKILTETANWIDKNLAHDAETQGQLHGDFSVRVVAVPISSTLAVISATFQVNADDRQVRVVRLTFRRAEDV